MSKELDEILDGYEDYIIEPILSPSNIKPVNKEDTKKLLLAWRDKEVTRELEGLLREDGITSDKYSVIVRLRELTETKDEYVR